MTGGSTHRLVTGQTAMLILQCDMLISLATSMNTVMLAKGLNWREVAPLRQNVRFSILISR